MFSFDSAFSTNTPKSSSTIIYVHQAIWTSTAGRKKAIFFLCRWKKESPSLKESRKS